MIQGKEQSIRKKDFLSWRRGSSWSDELSLRGSLTVSRPITGLCPETGQCCSVWLIAWGPWTAGHSSGSELSHLWSKCWATARWWLKSLPTLEWLLCLLFHLNSVTVSSDWFLAPFGKKFGLQEMKKHKMPNPESVGDETFRNTQNTSTQEVQNCRCILSFSARSNFLWIKI